MGKLDIQKLEGYIDVPGGFRLLSNRPIDSRFVGKDLSFLTDIKEAGGLYPGLRVFIESENLFYLYDKDGEGNYSFREDGNYLRIDQVSEEEANTVVKRSGSQIKVPLTPVDEKDAASKGYVDYRFDGSNKSVVFTNYSFLTSTVNTAEKGVYKIGQNFYIVEVGVPDLWVSEVLETSAEYNYTSDKDFTDLLETQKYVQIGYYKFSALETQKVDLTEYPTKSELEAEYVKFTDYATTSQPGIVQLGQGVKRDANNGLLYTDYANQNAIKAKTSYYQTIGPKFFDFAWKNSAITNTEEWQPEDKTAACNTIGALKQQNGVSDFRQAYVKTQDGSQLMVDLSDNTRGASIVVRRGTGHIYVPETPSDNLHATSKKYVDELIKSYATPSSPVETVNWTDRNPNATEIDPTLTGEIQTGAKAAYSTVLNKQTTAINPNSLAIGNKSIAKGDESIAGGYQSVTLASSAIAIGEQALAAGNSSAAFGNSTQALGYHSLAYGHSTVAGQFEGLNKENPEYTCALAGGTNSKALAQNSVAIGSNCKSEAPHSVSFGVDSVTLPEAFASISVGLGIKTTNAYQAAFGRYNEGIIGNILEVGFGESDTERKNVFSVTRDGRAKIDAWPIDLNDLTNKDYVCNNFIPKLDSETPGGIIPIWDASSLEFTNSGRTVHDFVSRITTPAEVDSDGDKYDRAYTINTDGVQQTRELVAGKPKGETICYRDSNGRTCVGVPTISDHAVNKGYVDQELLNVFRPSIGGLITGGTTFLQHGEDVWGCRLKVTRKDGDDLELEVGSTHYAYGEIHSWGKDDSGVSYENYYRFPKRTGTFTVACVEDLPKDVAELNSLLSGYDIRISEATAAASSAKADVLSLSGTVNSYSERISSAEAIAGKAKFIADQSNFGYDFVTHLIYGNFTGNKGHVWEFTGKKLKKEDKTKIELELYNTQTLSASPSRSSLGILTYTTYEFDVIGFSALTQGLIRADSSFGEEGENIEDNFKYFLDDFSVATSGGFDNNVIKNPYYGQYGFGLNISFLASKTNDIEVPAGGLKVKMTLIVN